MKKISFLFLLLTIASATYGQQYPGFEWNLKPAPLDGKPKTATNAYTNISVSETALANALSNVSANANKPSTIFLPQPNGTLRPFHIWETPIMQEPLASKYKGIHTYTANAINDRFTTAKIDLTPYGFHAMIVDGENTFFIDPFGDAPDGNYILYLRKDARGNPHHCAVGDVGDSMTGLVNDYTRPSAPLPKGAYRMNGTMRRTYRLALACTGEYSIAVAGANPTKGAVLAKMITSLNRVNSVYERDLAITMQLVGNNDTLIFLNGATDPFTNNNAIAMLAENQTLADAVIKSPNYDIGHAFATGSGSSLGVAYHGICDNTYKAQGVTGISNPTGDAFDIDFVAHEMGHQYGGEHSFNNNISGDCSGNAEQLSAYEPGSGSTIMAYAGICTGDNIQPHTDPYFHSASLEQITTFISTTTCGIATPAPNINATLANYTAIYNIPYLTAFELTSPAASDATADTLTYCWEQRNLGDFGKTLAQTRQKGPVFRSFRPTTNRTRIFPQIDSLLKSVFIYGQEKIPDTSRKLTFRVTERDIFQGYGAFNFLDDSIVLNVIYTGAPFRVTSPDANSNWAPGTTQTVLWNVANTDAAPINCSQVNIFLSTDGGYTFPTLLAANTANDGAETITLPNTSTANLRIKVKASGNVFFAISHTTPPTSIDRRLLNKDGIRVSPNPATKALEISFVRQGEQAMAKIVNAIGQLMWMGTIINQTRVDVSGWAKGIYYLRLSNDSTINTAMPFVVQ